MKNLYFKIGIILISIILLMMVISLFYTPYDPNSQNSEETFQSPNIKHIFGTDKFGRDIFSRVMTGSQTTFLIAFGTIIIGVAFGTVIGAFSGYFGGVADEIIMRINDALLSFPGMLLALIMVAVLGQGIHILVIALGIIFIPSYIRVVRGEFIRFRNLDFINSARAMGAKPLRIMFVHILPNAIPQLIPTVTIGFSNAVLAEASLSFLGLGVQPPDPSWGRMIAEGQSYLFMAPWISIIPGIMIILSVLGFNFIAEGISRIIGKGTQK